MSGLPIISYKVNPDNIISKNNIGHCADGDFNKMIAQIRHLLYDDADWKLKSKNAYNYVISNHDINTIGEHWKVILNQLNLSR